MKPLNSLDNPFGLDRVKEILISHRHEKAKTIHPPRTSQHVAEELHQLLTNAGEPGPYVLVGHSLGGTPSACMHKLTQKKWRA